MNGWFNIGGGPCTLPKLGCLPSVAIGFLIGFGLVAFVVTVRTLI